MSESLIQEFSKFEEKYKIQDESKPQLNFQDIDNENFDLEAFISHNFLLNKENNLINYAKLQEAFQLMHEMQGKTLEEIALSVDCNLESYMAVSKQFETIKSPLNQINETFIHLKNLLNTYRGVCRNSSKDLSDLIGNKEILEIYEEEYTVLKEIRKELLIIQGFLKKPSSFAVIAIARIFQKMVDSLDSLNKRFGGKIQGLIDKYRIKDVFLHQRQEFLGILDGKIREILKKMVTVEVETEKKDEIVRLLSSYELLKETKRAETIVQDVLIKPVVDNLITSILSSKTGGVITATKKEFIEKNLSNKIVLFRNIFEGIRAFMRGNFAVFISLQECKFAENLMYYGPAYCFVEILWSTVSKALSAKELSFIFSVGVADSFYQNYLIAEEMIDEFLGACIREKSKNFLTEIQSFKGKWILPTYFYLRNNEILKSFEKNMRTTIQNISEKIEKGMSGVLKGSFPLCAFLSDMVKTCFKKGVYLKALASSFLRLALQIINRFCNFLENYAKSLNIDDGSFNQEKVCFLANEIMKLSELLTSGEFLFPSILTPDINKLLISNMENKFNCSLRVILNPFIEKFAKASLDNLEPFNGIPAKFRMNVATINVQKPSNFIGNVFKSLQNFILSNMLAERGNEIVKKEVLDRVFKSFQTLIQEILKSSQKSEELMTKFISQDKNKESELEKIQMQFRLDFSEMKRLAQTKFGYEITLFIQELD